MWNQTCDFRHVRRNSTKIKPHLQTLPSIIYGLTGCFVVAEVLNFKKAVYFFSFIKLTPYISPMSSLYMFYTEESRLLLSCRMTPRQAQGPDFGSQHWLRGEKIFFLSRPKKGEWWCWGAGATVQQHWLLFREPRVNFPAPTWRLTTPIKQLYSQ